MIVSRKWGKTAAHAGRRSRRGLTMIEILIAVGVLMVSILSAVSSQVTSMNLMTTSRETSQAMSDLQAVMEEVLLYPADRIPDDDLFPPGTSIASYDGRNLQDQRIVPSYPGYLPGADVPDPLPIVLTMSWSDYAGRPRTLTLSSMKTR